VYPQASHNLVLRLVDGGVHLLQLLSSLELLLQRLNFLGHAVSAHVLLLLLLGERRGAGGCVAKPLCDRGFGRLVGFGR
jgi:hypothetical protein